MVVPCSSLHPHQMTLSHACNRQEPVVNCAVISGGLGGLGLLVAAWLAARGAREIILLGRSGRANLSPALTALCTTGLLSPARAGQQILAAGAGPAVRLVRCDVSDCEEVAAALSGRAPDLVCHASGVLQARPLTTVAVEVSRHDVAHSCTNVFVRSVARGDFDIAGAMFQQPSVPRT